MSIGCPGCGSHLRLCRCKSEKRGGRWLSRADQMVHDAEKNVLRERALRAEALVRAKDETIGELLGQSEYWYELWRKAGNALLACECRR